MLGNAKQFVPPTNKAHSPQINAGGGGGVGKYRNGWRGKKREIRKIRVLREKSARNVCGSR